MTAKHTPGSWAINGSEIEGDGMTVATITDYRTLTPRQVANAKLICAAPELLAALECLLGDIEQDILTDRGAHRMVKSGKRVEQARAAIAKATA
jgi:hypothetical protein